MDLSGLVVAYPNLLPILAAVPVVQVAAGLLAQLPRLWGVTHDTVWSRIWRTVASLPVVYRPTFPPADLSSIPPASPRGMARADLLGLLLFSTLLVTMIVAPSGCATVQRGLGFVEQSPVKTACFAFDPPVLDSTKTKSCTQLCVTTDPPSVLWQCVTLPPPATTNL